MFKVYQIMLICRSEYAQKQEVRQTHVKAFFGPRKVAQMLVAAKIKNCVCVIFI